MATTEAMKEEKMTSLGLLIDLMEKGYLPDWMIRWGVRNLCAQRLRSLEKESLESYQESFQDYLESLRSSPVAVATKDANRQHYEVPAEFFHLVLGKNKKYSSCFLGGLLRRPR